MSPVLMESGASSHILHLQSVHPARNPNSNGQISRSLLFDFSEFCSKEKMKSTNAGNRASGFPNSSEIDQNFSFSSRVMPRSGSENAPFGLSSRVSKPRLGKVRKNSQHPRYAAPETDAGPGFNPFRPTSDVSFVEKPRGGNDAFVFGGNRSNPTLDRNPDNEILDGMRKLKIANENVGGRAGSSVSEGLVDTAFVFGSKNLNDSSFDESVASALPNEMRKLSIGAAVNRECFEKNSCVTDKPPFAFQIGDNLGGSSGRSMGFQHPNEQKKSTNNRDNDNVTFDPNDAKKKKLGGSRKSFDSFTGSSSSALHDLMKKLNIAESVKTNVVEKKEVHNETINKNSFPFGSTGSARGYFSGKVENSLSDDMRKMEIRDSVGDTFGQTNMEKLGGVKFHKVGNSMPTEFTFQAGTNAKNLSGSQGPLEQSNDGIKMKGNPGTPSFSSHDIHLQANESAFQAPSMDKSEKYRSSFTSKHDERGTPHVDFSTPNPKVDLYSGFNQKIEFNAKKAAIDDKRVKRRKEKLKQSNPSQRRLGQDFVLRESSSQENPEASDSYSPMDVSPYQETLADNQFSRETSETSVESIHFDNCYASTDSHQTVSNDAIDEDLVVATQGLNINVDDVKGRETKEERDEDCLDQGVGAGGSLEESVSGTETGSFKCPSEQFDINSETTATSVETEVSLTSDIDKQDNDGRQQFCFASGTEDVGNTNFTFAASSSGQGQSAAAMRHHKKKNRVIVAPDSYDSAPNLKVPYTSSSARFFPLSSISPLLSPGQGQKGNISTSLCKGRNGTDSTEVEQQDTRQEFNPTSAATLAAQEACEKWRLRYLQYAIKFLSFC